MVGSEPLEVAHRQDRLAGGADVGAIVSIEPDVACLTLWLSTVCLEVIEAIPSLHFSGPTRLPTLRAT